VNRSISERKRKNTLAITIAKLTIQKAVLYDKFGLIGKVRKKKKNPRSSEGLKNNLGFITA
jgi:hypothetical protein